MTPEQEIAELRGRLAVLEAKDGARAAMHRYWRVLDYKQFDELEDCFTEDADADFGHNDELAVLNDREVAGIFKLEDWVTIGGMTVMRGFGQYNMIFDKCADGRFRISRLRLLHDYREESRVFVDGKMLSMTAALEA